MPINNNQHRDDLVKSLNNLADRCKARAYGKNGDAFSNFQIYFTLKANSISTQTFSSSENGVIDDFKVRADTADQSVINSGEESTINELNQLRTDLDAYFQ